MTLVGSREADVEVPDPLEFHIRKGIPEDTLELSGFWGKYRARTQLDVLQRYFSDVERGVQSVQVAEHGDKLVGQLWTRFTGIDPSIADDRNECYLHTLHVLEAYRRRGIARALTTASSEEARRRGRSILVIGVDRPNETAWGIYESWGFKRFYEANDLRGDLVFLRRRVFD